MSVFDEPKIDTHCHLFDPARFPYLADTPYRPAGQEIATATQMRHVFAAYGVRYALLTQPNSGYGEDNSCMLAGIAESGGRWKGVATVRNDASLEHLAGLKAQGIVGVAFNMPFHGVEYYRDTLPLIAKLEALDMFLQIQFHQNQLLDFLPVLAQTRVKLIIDHAGRPDLAQGLDGAAFQALLALGRSGRGAVKLSGYIKFSQQSHPYDDCRPYIHALVAAFTPERCLWGSDWPYLRAHERVDYGPLLMLAADLFPDPALRHMLFWKNPCRLFGFPHA